MAKGKIGTDSPLAGKFGGPAQGLFAAIGLALLAGCVAGGGAGSATSTQAAFLGGAIIAAAPAGYCINHRASHDDATGETAVVLIGKCSASAQSAPMLITATLGAPGSSAALKSGAQALSDYIRSPKGRASLARDGQAASVKIQKITLGEGALLIWLTDRATGPQWRAVMGLKTRLVSLSVTAPEGRVLSESGGHNLIIATIRAFKRANP